MRTIGPILLFSLILSAVAISGEFPEKKIIHVFPSKGVTINNATLIVPGENLIPRTWSPDSKRIALCRDKFEGLWVKDISQDKMIRLSIETGAGKYVVFSPDGNLIAYSRKEKKEGFRYKVKVCDLNKEEIVFRGAWFRGLVAISWPRAYILQVVYLENNRVKYKQYEFSEGMKGVEYAPGQAWGVVAYTDVRGQLFKVRVDGTRKKRLFISSRYLYNPVLYYNPVYFKHERVLAVDSREGHVYLVGIATGDVVDLGEGSNPSWGPEVDRVVFERVVKSGDKVSSSDIILADLENLKTYNLTNSPKTIERYPCLSPTGRGVVYSTPDGVYIADLVD